MAYNFDTAKEQATLTKNQDYLHTIDSRLKWLKNEGEISRLKMARADVVTRMSPEELSQYDILMTKTLTKEEEDAAMAKATKAMNENKDKPAI